MHRFTVILAVIAVTIGLLAATPASITAQQGDAPKAAADRKQRQERLVKPESSRVIPGQFIIQLRSDVPTAQVETTARELARGFDLDVVHV